MPKGPHRFIWLAFFYQSRIKDALDGKDGYYCTICGGIPPDQIKNKKIPIEGKEIKIKVILYNLSRLMKSFSVLIIVEEFCRAIFLSSLALFYRF
jgi:hypothetical protein